MKVLLRRRIRREVRAQIQREWESEHVRVTVSTAPLGVPQIAGHYTCEGWPRWTSWLPAPVRRHFDRQCGKPAYIAVEVLFRAGDEHGVPFRYCHRHGRRDVPKEVRS